MPEYILSVDKLCLQYNNFAALNDVSVEVRQGSIHAFIGENGAGKSSLMKVIAGVEKPKSGTVRFREQNIEKLDFYNVQKLGIRTIFQDVNLIPGMSVMDNMFLGNWITTGAKGKRKGKGHVIDKSKQLEHTRALLEKLDFNLDPNTRVCDLEAGQQKMVEIARSIIWDSSLLILDEVTAYLNDMETANLFKLLRSVAKLGHSVLIVSHKIDEVLRLADEISIMREGRLISTIARERFERDAIVSTMAGEPFVNRYPKLNRKPTRELLRLENVGDGEHVFDVSLTLRRGEILGISGLVGSGRTALAEIIAGIREADAGKLLVERREVDIASPRDAMRYRIAYIPDTIRSSLLPNMDVAQNITLSHLQGIVSHGMINKQLEASIAGDYAHRLGFKSVPVQKKVRELSGGTKQKVMLSKALLSRARIFVFNEPTKGLDVASKVEVYNLMNELILDDAGLIFISSDISELMGMCDRLMILYRGRIVAELAQKELSEARILHYASGLD